jgi:hypothetical protein
MRKNRFAEEQIAMPHRQAEAGTARQWRRSAASWRSPRPLQRSLPEVGSTAASAQGICSCSGELGLQATARALATTGMAGERQSPSPIVFRR